MEKQVDNINMFVLRSEFYTDTNLIIIFDILLLTAYTRFRAMLKIINNLKGKDSVK